MVKELDEYTTVWVYYKQGKLYAWTTNREIRDSFESQRNMKVFKRKKKRFTDIEYKAFMIKFKDQQLIDIPVDYNSTHYIVTGTYAEDTQLYLDIDEFSRNMDALVLYFERVNYRIDIPDKYLKSIHLLLHYSKFNDKGESWSNINTLSIFYKLFKDTF